MPFVIEKIVKQTVGIIPQIGVGGRIPPRSGVPNGLATANYQSQDNAGIDKDSHKPMKKGSRTAGNRRPGWKRRSVSGMARGAGLIDLSLDVFASFTGSLLDAANQFVLFAFGKLQIIVSEPGPSLLQLTFDDIPIPFHF
jgi:hypothetical protein